MKRLLTLLTLAVLAGCAQGPEPIRWGTDTCDQCRMVLTDQRFGAELIDGRGQVRKFDEIGELGAYMQAHPGEGQTFVVDATSGQLIPAQTATYLASPDINGPMGGSILGFADRTAAESYAEAEKLTQVTWPDYAEALRPEPPLSGGGDHGSH